MKKSSSLSLLIAICISLLLGHPSQSNAQLIKTTEPTKPITSSQSTLLKTMTTIQIPKRVGPKPQTTTINPHEQLDQFGSAAALQKALDAVKGLEGIRLGPSGRAPHGTVGLYIDRSVIKTKALSEAYMLDTEFAHFHPVPDGSLHMTLPPGVREQAISAGWAEAHPLAGRPTVSKQIVLVFAPRNDDEAAVVANLVKTSYQYARGQ
jgi:Family of unknown function (DUF5519)